LQGKLILGAADAVFQRHILHWLQKQGYAGYRRQFWPQALNYGFGAVGAVFSRLEVD